MPNRKIKHIVAKLVGASTEETLDVYDVDAIHTDKIYNALDQTAAGYVLDARQGKALNDSLTNYTRIHSVGLGPQIQAAATVSRLDSALYYRCGNIVNLVISNLSFSAAQTDKIIATGLPKPYVQQVIACPVFGSQNQYYRLGVSTGGNISVTCGTSLFYAVVTYITYDPLT